MNVAADARSVDVDVLAGAVAKLLGVDWNDDLTIDEIMDLAWDAKLSEAERQAMRDLWSLRIAPAHPG